MDDNEPTRASRRSQRLVGAVGLLLAGGLAGGVLAATNSASAADPTTPTATPRATTPAPREDTATSVRPGEDALTGSNLATAKAAALKAVPGGTVYRVETDADGATYEAHMTKADGSRVTVKLDKSLAVTSIEDGMGAGGPDGPGGHAGGAASSSGAAI